MTENIYLQCPLCGQDNNCAVSTGKPIEECWCNNTNFSSSALADVPESQRLVRCLCPACAQPVPDPGQSKET